MKMRWLSLVCSSRWPIEHSTAMTPATRVQELTEVSQLKVRRCAIDLLELCTDARALEKEKTQTKSLGFSFGCGGRI